MWRLVFAPFAIFGRLFRRRDEIAEFAGTLDNRGSTLIFLKRARFVMVPGSNIGHDYIVQIAKKQRTQTEQFILLPHVIFWTKGPERYRKGITDLLLGAPNSPGIRKWLGFFTRPQRIHIAAGEPVAVASVFQDDATDDVCARRLSWHLHQAIDQVEKITRGPMLKSAAQIRTEMMNSPDFMAGVEEAAQSMNLESPAARRRAAKCIQEIAADFRISYIEFLSIVLTPIFKRVFSSFVVDQDSVQAIREASKDSAVILVPCHRSHIDYLVISYLMYLLGVIPPHIAAGANLSFFPMGHIFRHSGAFFIRRVIGEDRIYAFVLAQYIRKLIKEGHSIEFFIEGGRSRTGKTLMPRFGLLNYVVDAVLSGAVRNVKVVPVALSYESIMEVEGYAREVTGGDKRKEDLTGLVRSAEVLDSRYGRLYLTAGRPINVADFFRKSLEQDPVQVTEDEKRYMVKRLGYLILNRINRATVVNPSGLVATVLLSHHRRGISQERFVGLAGFLLDFAIRRGYPISVTMERALKASRHDMARAKERTQRGADPRATEKAMGEALAPILQEAIDRFAASRHLDTEDYDEGPVISVRQGSRIFLNYYRNNIIHVFQREALVALSLFAHRDDETIRVQSIEEDLQFLSKLLQREFIFRVGDFKQGILAGLGALERHGIVLRIDGTVRLVTEQLDLLRIFRNMVLPIAESYLICARYAPIVRWKGALKPKDLARAILSKARKDYGEGDVTCQESLSTVNMVNAIERYLSMDVLTRVESGIDAGKIRFAKGSAEEEMARLEKRLEVFVDVVA
jgi:glycerol-3-phosphate O-acyltransferase